MTQHELDSAVAQATGESLGTIAARGFSLVEMDAPQPLRLSRRPRMVDWDALDAGRTSYLPQRRRMVVA